MRTTQQRLAMARSACWIRSESDVTVVPVGADVTEPLSGFLAYVKGKVSSHSRKDFAVLYHDACNRPGLCLLSSHYK
jgi:hypothetical protein